MCVYVYMSMHACKRVYVCVCVHSPTQTLHKIIQFTTEDHNIFECLPSNMAVSYNPAWQVPFYR
jgi:hypothetical protein